MIDLLENNWEIISKDDEEHLQKRYDFDSFKSAIDFITKVALISEQQNHHPEIWNSYNVVQLSLTTKDHQNRITEKDELLARSIDELV
jgi:4a-hydroxytetrahydrobiopterin dehydratase